MVERFGRGSIPDRHEAPERADERASRGGRVPCDIRRGQVHVERSFFVAHAVKYLGDAVRGFATRLPVLELIDAGQCCWCEGATVRGAQSSGVANTITFRYLRIG